MHIYRLKGIVIVIVIIHNCGNIMQENLIKHNLQSNIYKTMQFWRVHPQKTLQQDKG